MIYITYFFYRRFCQPQHLSFLFGVSVFGCFFTHSEVGQGSKKLNRDQKNKSQVSKTIKWDQKKNKLIARATLQPKLGNKKKLMGSKKINSEHVQPSSPNWCVHHKHVSLLFPAFAIKGVSWMMFHALVPLGVAQAEAGL